ncbi:hypothetical protein BpHYR1_015346 [Brachionus plicatilis]|uniref:Uncharacterized protein n=1 Tax=Brachionus plicatilis TaxID=10195 RepID=A0A3M7T4Z9_BRAPC|nr:hypothetical protein BpHYR1_015346 [Brachionus plicatilis]
MVGSSFFCVINFIDQLMSIGKRSKKDFCIDIEIAKSMQSDSKHQVSFFLLLQIFIFLFSSSSALRNLAFETAKEKNLFSID